jgi:CRISPR-associated protein Cas2
MAMFVVISYDVADDRRRAKVADILLGSGERVQFSVFECRLTGEELEKLRAKLTKAIAPTEDSVRFYSLCERCHRAVVVDGKGVATEDHDFYVV